MMNRFLMPLGVFVLLAAVLYVGVKNSPDREHLRSVLIGRPAPQFTLPDLMNPGSTLSNAKFKGKPYLVNVWGTWCVTCRVEHPMLMQLSQKQDVPILGLNWKDELPLAQRWLQVLGNPYVVSAFDPEGNVGIDWGAYGAPETFLVDARGIVIHKRVSPMTVDVWERDFLPLIKQAGAKGE